MAAAGFAAERRVISRTMLGRNADAVLAPPGRQAGLADAGGSIPVDGLVEFAQRVARGSTAERVAFHAGYRSVAVDPGIDRVDHNWTTGLFFRQTLTPHWSWNAEYTFYKRNSNAVGQDVEQNIIFASISYTR